MEERESASHAISHHLEPVCPRDDHHMKFDSDGVRWSRQPTMPPLKLQRITAGMGVQSATRRSTATLPL